MPHPSMTSRFRHPRTEVTKVVHLSIFPAGSAAVESHGINDNRTNKAGKADERHGPLPGLRLLDVVQISARMRSLQV
jgi:hypothetical protein